MPCNNLLAISVGKLSAWASKALKVGSGSSLPGMLALKISPKLLGTLAKNINTAIVVTGTNGKSTTAGLLQTILTTMLQKPVIHNHLGANMKTGLTTALLKQSNLYGRIKTKTAVYEVDEASLPVVAPDIQQKWTVVTNLFRDQLDRYGELDTTARFIASGIQNSATSGLILNADDPLVTHIAEKFKGENTRLVIYFGFSETATQKYQIENNTAILDAVQIPIEVTDCPKCGNKLAYSHINYGHLGHYSCQKCDFKRPDTQITLLDFEVSVGNPTKLTLQLEDSTICNLHINLEGRFNFYNVLAAIAGVYKMQPELITEAVLQEGLDQYQSIFGRSQACTVNDKSVMFYLIKNPIGAGEVLKTITHSQNRQCLIVINDLAADGKDISWLWDAPFELLATSPEPILVSGRRAQDMALRLQYAGVPLNKILVISDPVQALNQLTNQTQAGQTAFVLPTYTALLDYSQHLGSR